MFHKDWFWHSDVDRGDTQQGGFIILRLFFKIRKVGQNMQFRRELCVCHISAKKHGEHGGCNIGRSDDKSGLNKMSTSITRIGELFSDRLKRL
jgi:hypothetical protein